MIKLTTEISHDELKHAWAPLVDVSMALDRLVEQGGGANAAEIIRFMDNKVKRVLEPLEACIERIVKENPDQFG